ncbi:MAG: 5'-nucleotidase C-terminal domain-containing protein [Candidatus Eremiobacterota bacterium]
MNINRINYTKHEYDTKTIKNKSEKDSLSVNDSVTLSSHEPKKEDFLTFKHKSSVTLPVTLDIEGYKTEKHITGTVSDKEIVLNMKHTNDIHGNMASVSTLIEPDEFWVDAGDASQGYRFHSIVSGGREEIDLMNNRDCDLAITGNHFYDDGGFELGNALIGRATFPILGANTKGLAPYATAEIEGIKIAFIGVRTPDKKDLMVDPSKVKDLILTDPLEAVKKSVEEVKGKGIKNIILLSHLGLEPNEAHKDIISDKDIAREVPGIDLIIGGHTHTPTKEKVEVNGTRIVHAGIGAHTDVNTDDLYLGDLSLTFDRGTGKIVSIEHKLIPVDRKSPIDEDVKTIKDKYVMEENTILSEKLGFLNKKLIHDIKTPTDSTLGNLVTDAIREETQADVVLLDSNFFATDRKNPPPSVLPKGEITMEDLTETSLWMGKSLDASVETWSVTGETIKKILEDGVSKLVGPKNTQGLYQVSGLNMTYDPKKPEGERVSDIFIGDKPLETGKNYKLATSYIQGNWNSLMAGRDETSVEDGRKIRLIVADYIRDKVQINSAEEGRIKIVISK